MTSLARMTDGARSCALESLCAKRLAGRHDGRYDPGELVGQSDGGFARQADALSKRRHGHERVARYRAMFERRQALNDIVMDRRVRSAEDESLIPQILPGNCVLVAKRMRVR
jgi:hypothetical protein